MELSEFRNNLNRKWQRKIQKSCWIAFYIILCVELIVFFTYRKLGAIEKGGVFFYLLVRIVLPSGLNLLALCVTRRIINSERISVKNKNYAVCIDILIICAVTAAVHNFYFVIWMAPSVALFYSTLFNNNRVLTMTYVGSLLSALISMTINLLEGEFGLSENLIYCMITMGIFSFAYYISRIIIKHHIKQLEYTYEELEKQQKLIEQLDIEPMTRLYNRKAFERNMTEVLADCKIQEEGSQKRFWLLILDLDLFKQVNDTYGHLNGDKVLLKVAALLQQNVDKKGRVYRYGGEEFAVLTAAMTKETVAALAEKLRAQVERLRFEFDFEKRITTSIGVAPCQSRYSLEQWTDAADAALYLAKKNGRNQVKMI